ncbi:Pectate lyase superfamily protein [Niabella drilacis]|uniref:Pectate lyase superfamily protein n=2 Tax=Niabella drilacis (strain DSM 25811 / CCM 8410 / CCUG 62505 / LMG 26954 / E90) TaxID=1285928 RepID=A0A1G6R0P3_NIADE|nr:Pectate lyase superfamily protein [Niabella drilacis]
MCMKSFKRSRRSFCLAVLLLLTTLWSAAQKDKNVNINPHPESADVVSVLDFGARPDGQADATGAFQKALTSFGTKGGTVYVPRGTYLFKGSLNIPQAVTLKGAFESVPSHNGIRNKGLPKPGDDGTTFLITGNRGTEDAAPFITLNTNSTLRGVVLYWPLQDPENIPEPYPWGIAMRGKNPAVLDVEMLNPYNAIDASKNERALIRNISGQALRRGIYVDGIYDIGRIENVHWNPWWSMKPRLFNWQKENGEAFIFERTDWHYVFNTFCFGYKTGYKFGASSGSTGACNGNFLGIGADDCQTAVLVEQSAPYGLLITNGEFVAMEGADPTMVVVTGANKGNVRFVNCAFWGPCNRNAMIDGTGTIGFSDCTFVQWDRNKEGLPSIQVNSGTLLVRGCDFGTNAPQVAIGESVSRAIVSENTVKGKVNIINKIQNAFVNGNIGTEQ